MGLKNLFIVTILLSVLLVGCGSGGAVSPRPNPNDTSLYGQLQESPTLGATFNVTQLQSWLLGNYGICPVGSIPDNESTVLCSQNESYIESNVAIFGNEVSQNLTSFVQDNSLSIAQVNAYQLIYTTPGAPYSLSDNATQTQTVSGSILIPQVESSVIKGIVLYYHPTAFSKFEVPSFFSDPVGENYDYELAAIYASQGYIVVAPDYVGQGVNTSVVHPYVAYPQTNALSGLYMLKAARQFLQQQGITQNLSLYITSYSEGGAYALWASNLAQNGYSSILTDSNVTLKRTVGISGAYDLTGVMLPFAFANESNSLESSINTYNVSPGCSPYAPNGNGSLCHTFESTTQPGVAAALNLATYKAPLGGYLMTAFITYNGLPSMYTKFMPASFVNMGSCLNFNEYYVESTSMPSLSACLIGEVNYNLSQLFSSVSTSLTGSAIANAILSSAAGATNYMTGGQTYSQLTAAMLNGYNNNSVGSFIDEAAIMDNPLVMPFLTQQNIYNWTTNNPISLIYLNYDSVVSNLNSLEACGQVTGISSVYANSSSGMVTCQMIDSTQLWMGGDAGIPLNLDHPLAEPILQLAALQQIQSSGN